MSPISTLRSWLIALIIAAGVSGCAMAGNDGQTALDAVSQGHSDANAPVMDALRQDPHDPRTQLAAALYYERQGRPLLARQYYQAVILGRQPAMASLEDGQPPRSTAAVAAQRLTALGQGSIAAISPIRADYRIVATLPVTPQLVSGTPSTRLTPGAGAFELDPVVQRYVVFIHLVEAGIASEAEYQDRRRANLGGLLPYSSSASTPADRLLPPTVNEIRQQFQDIEQLTTTMKNAETYRETRRREILDGLLPLKPSTTPARAVLNEWPKDRAIALAAAGLISTEEMQHEVLAVYATGSSSSSARRHGTVSPYATNRPWVSR